MTIVGAADRAASPEARFSALFARHYPAVFGYAARRVGREEAADAAAEVFTVAWRRVGRRPVLGLPVLQSPHLDDLSPSEGGQARREGRAHPGRRLIRLRAACAACSGEARAAGALTSLLTAPYTGLTPQQRSRRGRSRPRAGVEHRGDVAERAASARPWKRADAWRRRLRRRMRPFRLEVPFG